MRNLRRVGKNAGPILSCLWTKVHVVSRRCRTPLVVVNAFTDCLYRVLFRRYRLLNLPLSYEKRRILRARVKMPVLFLAISGPKFLSFRDDIEDPL